MKKKLYLLGMLGIMLVFTNCTSIPAQLANDRGVELAEQEEYERAIVEFTESIELAPNYALAYFNRGLAYYYLGDYDNAIKDYTEALRLKPSDSKYRSRLQQAEEAKNKGN